MTETVYTVSGYGASPHVHLFPDHVPGDVLTSSLGGLKLISCYVDLVDLLPAVESLLGRIRVAGRQSTWEGAPCLIDKLAASDQALLFAIRAKKNRPDGGL